MYYGSEVLYSVFYLAIVSERAGPILLAQSLQTGNRASYHMGMGCVARKILGSFSCCTVYNVFSVGANRSTTIHTVAESFCVLLPNRCFRYPIIPQSFQIPHNIFQVFPYLPVGFIFQGRLAFEQVLDCVE